MTKDVLISIKGLHTDAEAEEEEIEFFSAGTWYFRNGKHYVLYEEQDAESGQVTRSRITLCPGRLEVKRQGPFRSVLIFEENQKSASLYETPFGSLQTAVEVIEMDMSETEELIEACVDYLLEINDTPAARRRIRIRVMAKDSGQFRLRSE